MEIMAEPWLEALDDMGYSELVGRRNRFPHPDVLVHERYAIGATTAQANTLLQP